MAGFIYNVSCLNSLSLVKVQRRDAVDDVCEASHICSLSLCCILLLCLGEVRSIYFNFIDVVVQREHIKAMADATGRLHLLRLLQCGLAAWMYPKLNVFSTWSQTSRRPLPQVCDLLQVSG